MLFASTKLMLSRKLKSVGDFTSMMSLLSRLEGVEPSAVDFERLAHPVQRITAASSAGAPLLRSRSEGVINGY